MSKQSSTLSWAGAIVVVLAVVAAGAYLAHKAMQPVAPVDRPAPSLTTAEPPVAEAPVAHPIEQAQPATASTAALPALGDSDADVTSALAALAAGTDLPSLLVRQQIIQRIVTTVDALPRRGGLGTLTLPARTPKGAFAVDGAEGAFVPGSKNEARYAPYMQVVDAVDPQALVAWYVHAYPLFQQAYRELGYPQGYFNDRLIVAIDDLLAAPEPAQPPVLVRSKSFYAYGDPALESLSTGQKLMLRVGTPNAAKIKAKLRTIRKALVGRNLDEEPSAPAAGATAD